MMDKQGTRAITLKTPEHQYDFDLLEYQFKYSIKGRDFSAPANVFGHNGKIKISNCRNVKSVEKEWRPYLYVEVPDRYIGYVLISEQVREELRRNTSFIVLDRDGL